VENLLPKKLLPKKLLPKSHVAGVVSKARELERRKSGAKRLRKLLDRFTSEEMRRMSGLPS